MLPRLDSWAGLTHISFVYIITYVGAAVTPALGSSLLTVRAVVAALAALAIDGSLLAVLRSPLVRVATRETTPAPEDAVARESRRPAVRLDVRVVRLQNDRLAGLLLRLLDHLQHGHDGQPALRQQVPLDARRPLQPLRHADHLRGRHDEVHGHVVAPEQLRGQFVLHLI